MGSFSLYYCMLSYFSSITFIVLILFIVVNFLWIINLFIYWKRDFSHRLYRSHKKSLVKNLPPKPKISDCHEKPSLNSESLRFNYNSERLKTHTGAKNSFDNGNKAEKLTLRDSELQLDCLRLNFLDFLWANYFIVPNTMFLFASGLLKLKLREFFHRVLGQRLGIDHPSTSVDYSKVAARLILEGTQLAQFNKTYKNNDYHIATFVWKDFPMLSNSGDSVIAKTLKSEVDIRNKTLLEATLDSRSLAARDAAVLIFFNTISANHVKLHAYANWACNTENRSLNGIQHRMSISTVTYNYLGTSRFPALVDNLHRWRITSDFHGIRDVFEAGRVSGVLNHSGITAMEPYSEFAHFILKVRRYFHRTFKEHKQDFRGTYYTNKHVNIYTLTLSLSLSLSLSLVDTLSVTTPLSDIICTFEAVHICTRSYCQKPSQHVTSRSRPDQGVFFTNVDPTSPVQLPDSNLKY